MSAFPKDGGGEADHAVHTYDGIEEHNHPLPGWWQWTLYGAIVVAAIYWFDFEVLKVHPSPRRAYEQQAARDRQAAAEQALAAGAMTSDVLLALSRDPATVAKGKETFTSICATCHRADGGGNIGPNLTDAYWLHGSRPEDLYKVVHDGVDGKGMQAWAPQLGERRVASAVAYVLTLRDTNVPGGKPPQGTQEE